MNQQCGNCKWWDRENKSAVFNYAGCNFMIDIVLPNSFTKDGMLDVDGKDCPCFEEVEE